MDFLVEVWRADAWSGYRGYWQSYARYGTRAYARRVADVLVGSGDELNARVVSVPGN